MKTLTATFIILSMILLSCTKDPVIVKGYYDSIHFVREGGRETDFVIYPTDDTNQVNVIISKYDFQDTTIQISLDKDLSNTIAFSAFQEACNGKCQINGDYRRSSSEAGTWSYIYMVSDKGEIEVTSVTLRENLSKFEELVSSKIETDNN